jgi:hypothetical protein
LNPHLRCSASALSNRRRLRCGLVESNRTCSFRYQRFSPVVPCHEGYGGPPQRGLGRDSTSLAWPRSCRSSNAKLKVGRSCAAHYLRRRYNGIAIDFMKPAKLARRWSIPTSQSGIRRSRRDPAPRYKFRRQSSAGAVKPWDFARLLRPRIPKVGRGSHVTCSRSRHPRALRRVFLPRIQRAFIGGVRSFPRR